MKHWAAALLRWLSAHLWVVPTAVLVFAGLIRFWNLSSPSTLVFDEVFYVRDAASQLVHGYPTVWPENLGYAFGPEELALISADPSYAVHPPLGKWLIGVGLSLFGATNGLGWRFATALVGTLSVAVLMLVTARISRSVWVASLAGLLLAIEGVSIVLSRVALLDGFLAFFALLGALFMLLDYDWVGIRWREFAASRHRKPSRFGPVFLWRPWLLAAAVAFGAAASVKWSGLYFVAAFGLVTVVRDAIVRRRLGIRWWLADSIFRQGMLTLVTTLPVVALTYLASWTGWIVTSGGWARQTSANWWSSLFTYHVDMLAWHGSLQAPHPYAAHPLTWLLGLRPTSMYFESAERGEQGCGFELCATAISPIPNVLIWWGGVAALVWLMAWVIRRTFRSGAHTRQAQAAPPAAALNRGALIAITGFAAGYLPWLLTVERTAVFQFYTVVFAPYLVLALTLALWRAGVSAPAAEPGAVRARRWLVGGYIGAVVLVSAYFLPLWMGIQTSFAFWNLHMWLPSWR